MHPRNTGPTDVIIIIRPLGAAVVPHPDTLPRLKSLSSYWKLNARVIRKLTYFDVTYYLFLLGTDVGKFIPRSSRNFREDCSSWSQGSRFVISATTKYRTSWLRCVSLQCLGLCNISNNKIPNVMVEMRQSSASGTSRFNLQPDGRISSISDLLLFLMPNSSVQMAGRYRYNSYVNIFLNPPKSNLLPSDSIKNFCLSWLS